MAEDWGGGVSLESERATCTLDLSLENLMSLTLGSAVRALTVFEEIGQKFKVNLAVPQKNHK